MAIRSCLSLHQNIYHYKRQRQRKLITAKNEEKYVRFYLIETHTQYSCFHFIMQFSMLAYGLQTDYVFDRLMNIPKRSKVQ